MKKTKEQISYNMRQVKNKDSAIELILRKNYGTEVCAIVRM